MRVGAEFRGLGQSTRLFRSYKNRDRGWEGTRLREGVKGENVLNAPQKDNRHPEDRDVKRPGVTRRGSGKNPGNISSGLGEKNLRQSLN